MSFESRNPAAKVRWNCDAVEVCEYDLCHISISVSRINKLIIIYKSKKTKTTNLNMSEILTGDT